MQTWEYATIFYNGQGTSLLTSLVLGRSWNDLQECLDEMGKNGWELVGTTPPISLGIQYSAFYLLFKRLV